jgi:Na+-translocating ferredoxin:NAD+ oxidoreductase RnfC subunit
MQNKLKYNGVLQEGSHKMIDFRRVPIKNLMAKIDILKCKNHAELIYDNLDEINEYKILLKQHIGVVSKPIVNINDNVNFGDKISSCNENLGSEIHSPVNGIVTKITDDYIIIKKN